MRGIRLLRKAGYESSRSGDYCRNASAQCDAVAAGGDRKPAEANDGCLRDPRDCGWRNGWQRRLSAQHSRSAPAGYRAGQRGRDSDAQSHAPPDAHALDGAAGCRRCFVSGTHRETTGCNSKLPRSGVDLLDGGLSSARTVCGTVSVLAGKPERAAFDRGEWISAFDLSLDGSVERGEGASRGRIPDGYPCGRCGLMVEDCASLRDPVHPRGPGGVPANVEQCERAACGRTTDGGIVCAVPAALGVMGFRAPAAGEGRGNAGRVSAAVPRGREGIAARIQREDGGTQTAAGALGSGACPVRVAELRRGAGAR